MVVGAFPLFKLGALVLKQVSKPLANVVKARAKSNPFFRTYICMPPAQFYHWWEVKMKMWTMNLGKPVNIPKLNETMAIELGAELLGEGVIFVTAAAILIFEYVRTSRKEAAKEEHRVQELALIQSELKDLYFAKAKQDAQLRELIRVLHINIPSASILQTDYNPNDIPEHHRHNEIQEESSIFGTMKGLVWSAVDILLPPVNQEESSMGTMPQVRTTIVNGPYPSSRTSTPPSHTEKTSLVDQTSGSLVSNNSNSPNSKPSGRITMTSSSCLNKGTCPGPENTNQPMR